MNSKPSCAVIGAGFVGICTALKFIEKGFAVTLYDRQGPGLGASFGNAGFIATELVNPLATAQAIRKAIPLLLDRHGALRVPLGNWAQSVPWMFRFAASARPAVVQGTRQALASLQRLAVPAWKDLLGQERLLDQLVPTHYMKVWEDSTRVAAARAEQAFYNHWGTEAEFADQRRVAELEPVLKGRVHHAVLLPYAHRVRDPYQLSLALFKAFTLRGGKLKKEDVWEVRPISGSVTVTSTTAQKSFTHAVVCAGAHSAKLMQSLGLRVPLMAERGYHLNLTRAKGLLNGPICSADRNVFFNPLDEALRVVGFSEMGGVDLPPVPERFDTLRWHFNSLFPGSEHLLTGASEWMGMRPTLPDSKPIIDTHPAFPNLGFVFGHSHVGLTLAAATADLISSRMILGDDKIDLSPFKATRFVLSGDFNSPTG